MSIPPSIVACARSGWRWQWNKLMNGLAPSDKDGNYCRPPSQAKESINITREDLIQRSKNEIPILIIGRSCPWAHRTWLIYTIRQLKRNINLVIAKPNLKAGFWTVNTSLLKESSLLDIYQLCNAPPSNRATVPVLIDPIGDNKIKPKLLGNESAQLVETLNFWPSSDENIPDLFPKDLQLEIHNWHNILQDSVNNGVYKCGFARNQYAYQKASDEMFCSLSKLEKSLSKKGPWLCGEKLTIADIRLFPTMIRWEAIYAPLFGCSQRHLSAFPNILNWRKKFFNIANVSKTCNSENWRKDYFGALFPLNPSNIVPNGPSIEEIIQYS